MSAAPKGREPITVTLERVPHDRGFRVRCSPGYITDKAILFSSPEMADEIEAGLAKLTPEAQTRLAADMAFTELDDSRIDHPDGAGIYMKEAIEAACVAA